MRYDNSQAEALTNFFGWELTKQQDYFFAKGDFPATEAEWISNGWQHANKVYEDNGQKMLNSAILVVKEFSNAGHWVYNYFPPANIKSYAALLTKELQANGDSWFRDEQGRYLIKFIRNGDVIEQQLLLANGAYAVSWQIKSAELALPIGTNINDNLLWNGTAWTSSPPKAIVSVRLYSNKIRKAAETMRQNKDMTTAQAPVIFPFPVKLKAMISFTASATGVAIDLFKNGGKLDLQIDHPSTARAKTHPSELSDAVILQPGDELYVQSRKSSGSNGTDFLLDLYFEQYCL